MYVRVKRAKTTMFLHVEPTETILEVHRVHAAPLCLSLSAHTPPENLAHMPLSLYENGRAQRFPSIRGSAQRKQVEYTPARCLTHPNPSKTLTFRRPPPRRAPRLRS